MVPSQYFDEYQYLEQTICFIDAEVKEWRDNSPQAAAYKEAAQALQDKRDERLQRYLKARSEPYFGRVDFLEDAGEHLKIYVGTFPISGGRVYAWTSPFARQLYARDPGTVRKYETRTGPSVGRVTLKRRYRIENSQLLDVKELWLAPAAPSGSDALDASGDYLIERLSAKRGGHLRETVATIQPDQYEQIAATLNDVLLLQGVAGSGKSNVGLHRIAYLLSPFNERPERLTAANVAFFGPTRTFLNYVAHLLPSIDVTGITQKTVKDWLESRLSRKLKIGEPDSLLEQILTHPANWESAHRMAQLKGSLKMAHALDQHVETLRGQALSAVGDLRLVVDSFSMVIPATEVRALVESMPRAPLNTLRNLTLARLTERTWKQVRLRSEMSDSANRKPPAAFTRLVQPQLEQQLDRFWSRIDFAGEYRRLLSTPSELALASKDRLDAQDLSLLAGSMSRRPTHFHAEDLGALCYLDSILNDRPNSRFQHVVVDEAQEVSPLEFLMLQRHSQGNGFTILGDVAQSLSPQSVSSWPELLRLFRGSTVSQWRVRSSYRSTWELTNFANCVLKRAHPTALTAKPIDRHGPAPEFLRADSYPDMVRAIANTLNGLQQAEMQTIAILCKTALEARKLHKSLRGAGVKGVGLLDRRGSTPLSIVVAPIYMVRGLEFDAVILASAHRRNYTSLALHTKLLYLAVTRAAHQLHIHWFGTLAEALGPAPRQRAQETASAPPSRPT